MLVECGRLTNVTGHGREAYLPQLRDGLTVYCRLFGYGSKLVMSPDSTYFATSHAPGVRAHADRIGGGVLNLFARSLDLFVPEN
jgi:hypothetical protein